MPGGLNGLLAGWFAWVAGLPRAAWFARGGAGLPGGEAGLAGEPGLPGGEGGLIHSGSPSPGDGMPRGGLRGGWFARGLVCPEGGLPEEWLPGVFARGVCPGLFALGCLFRGVFAIWGSD